MVEVVYLDPLTALYRGDCREVLASMPAESVQSCITSPPYWGLRDYKIPPVIWGGLDGCEHEWGAELSERKRGNLHGANAQAGNTLSGVSGTEVKQGQSCAKCGAWQGSLGLEPSPELYVEHIVEVFRAVKRVLRKDGTVWLNMGDSYAGSNCGSNDYRPAGASISKSDTKYQGQKPGLPAGLKPKDLCGLPWRVAFALQADGWWLRSDIIWAKRNPMPESLSGSRWERHRAKIKSQGVGTSPQRIGVVLDGQQPQRNAPGGVFQDPAEWEDCPGCALCEPNDGLVLRHGSWRPTTAHEYIFMLAKSHDYYADGEAVREPHTETSLLREAFEHRCNRQVAPKSSEYGMPANIVKLNPAGRNKRSVWEISTQNYSGEHFATFPEKLVEPCLLAGTSERGACPKCGKAWLRVIAKEPSKFSVRVRDAKAGKASAAEGYKASQEEIDNYLGGDRASENEFWTQTLGWRAACGCGDAETVPCLVLDPFAGSGTVGVVARRWGRKAILIELSEKYCKLAVERLTGAQPALGVTDA